MVTEDEKLNLLDGKIAFETKQPRLSVPQLPTIQYLDSDGRKAHHWNGPQEKEYRPGFYSSYVDSDTDDFVDPVQQHFS